MSKETPGGKGLLAPLNKGIQSIGVFIPKIGAALKPEGDQTYVKFLSRSALLQEATPPSLIRNSIVLIAAFLGGFLIWAGIAKFDEKTVAPGEILPINFVQPVQHLEGGIVAGVLVQDGDIVTRGQPLVLLDETAPKAELDSIRARYAALSLQAERLRAFSLSRKADFSRYENSYPALVEDHANILETQIAAREAQIAVINAELESLQQEKIGLEEQEQVLIRQVALVQEEADLRRELLEKGLTSRVVYLATQRELNRTKGDKSDVISRLARNQASMAEANGRILELEARLRNDALNEMGRVVSEQAQVKEQLARLQDRVSRLSITAPVSGKVKGLTVTSIGAVVSPGDVVAEIVPDREEFVAEVRISPKDIGHLAIGKEALVKIETYNFARLGGIKGNLTHISATSFRDEEGRPYFRGLVKLDQDYVGPDPRSNRITPGMTLSADIKTGDKTLLGYLTRPVYNSLSTAFSER